MPDFMAIGAAKKYTDDTSDGMGALKGKNCTIQSITPIEGGNRVTFSWTKDDGIVVTSTMDVMNGDKGSDGLHGKSAYDIWLEAGNTGTEQDFLDSFKGEKGDKGADGTMTFEDLTDEQKASLKGDPGDDGADGKSAYDIWLEAGNTGTEEEFLNSLKGADGTMTFEDLTEEQKESLKGEYGKSAYDIWLEAGNTGTEEDFLESLKGEGGAIGIDGKSAYDIWLEAGNTGTEEDFLESLKGIDGAIGIDGKSTYDIWLEAGNTGTEQEFLDSLKGEEGKSAYQVWLDEGNTGSEEDFLNSLKGSDGTSVNILGDLASTDELPDVDQEKGDGYLINGDLWVYTASVEPDAINGFVNVGSIKGPAGNDGFSTTITPNPDNTDKNYRLDITTKDGTFTTPNLRGGDEVTKYTYVVDGTGVTIYYSYVDLSTKVGETVSVTVSNKYGMYETELTVINIISDTELTVSPGGGEITITLTNVETTTAELINDNITATTSTWSSQRIANELGQVFDNLTPEQTITVDEELNTTSTNPIQNKAVAEKFDEIEGLLKDEVVYWYNGSYSVEAYKTEIKITADMIGTEIPIIIVSDRYGESSDTVTIEAQVDENTFTVSGSRNDDFKFAYEESIKSNGINDSQTSTETTWSSLHIQDVIDNTIGDIAGEILKDSIISDDTTWSSNQIRKEVENLIEDGYANSRKVYSSVKVTEEINAVKDMIPEIDDTLDATSENAIKNKVVAEKFEEIDEILAQGGHVGADGKSAYEIWLEAGNTGTEDDFFNSLKGEKGDTGEQGPKGDTGEQGPKGDTGANGTTPTIKAAAGSNINTVGTPSVTASTSGTTTTFTFNNLKGAKGDKGDTGAAGTNGTTPTIKAAAGSNINTVGTPSVTASTSGTTTTFTFNNLKGAKGDTGAAGTNGTTPTIKASAGSNIGSVGTPSVSASTSGTTTTFTFNYLKGAKGDKGDTGATGSKGATGATGASPLIHVNGMGGGERTMAELGTNEGIIAICTNVSGGSFFTSVTDGTVKCNGASFTSSKQPTAGTSYVIVNSGSSTARIYCKNNGGSAWTIIGDVL